MRKDAVDFTLDKTFPNKIDVNHVVSTFIYVYTSKTMSF